MRFIYLIFLLSFGSLLLNCNNTKLKESEPQKAVKQTEIKEIFSVVKPLNKPEELLYTTLYNGYSISIQSNSSHQEIIFKKGNIETRKVLKFYHENPEIVFHLYKSNLDNLVLLIEGRDYYGSNLGIYYIENKTNRIIEIDHTLAYTQDDPETKGFKLPKAEIIKKDNELKCKVYLGNKLLSDKTYAISAIEQNSTENREPTTQNNTTKSTTSPDHWNGHYHFEASNRDEIKTSYNIKIKSLNDISIQINDGGDKESYFHIRAEKLNEDKIKIVFNPSLEDEMGIIYIEKSDNTYFISGYPIYFINPGNNEIPLTKEK